jgi:hypothetical protein
VLCGAYVLGASSYGQYYEQVVVELVGRRKNNRKKKKMSAPLSTPLLSHAPLSVSSFPFFPSSLLPFFPHNTQATKLRNRLRVDFTRAFSGEPPVPLLKKEGGSAADISSSSPPSVPSASSSGGVPVDVMIMPTAPLPPTALSAVLATTKAKPSLSPTELYVDANKHFLCLQASFSLS